MNANLILARGRRGKLHQGIGPKVIVIFRNSSSMRIKNLQSGIQGRTEPGRLHFTGDSLSLAGYECPDIPVLSRKNPAVDGYRNGHFNRNRIAVDLLFHDLRQVAYHKFDWSGGSTLGIPQSPRLRAQRTIGA